LFSGCNLFNKKFRINKEIPILIGMKLKKKLILYKIHHYSIIFKLKSQI